MVVSTQPTETVAGQVIVGNPAVLVRDASNDPVGAGTEVTVAINKSFFTGASTLSATTDASGIATFSNLILETADTGYELTFSSSGIPDVTSDAFEVIPADPDYLTITQQPQNTLQGRVIKGFPTVTLYDEFDNTIAGIAITVSLSKSNFTAGSTLTATTNLSGKAVFSNLAIATYDTGYTITFDADDAEAASVAVVTSNSFEIYEEKFTITIQNQPIHSVEGYTLEAADIVNPIRVRVANMADVPVASGTINVALSKGSFAAGSTTSASISGGIAIFNNLVIDDADTDYQLIFSNPSVYIADVPSNAFNVATEGATMSMSINTTESIEGIALYGPPTLHVEDSGTPQVGVEITAYLSKNDFTGLSTITSTTNASGLAEFANLIVDVHSTDYRIFFKATPPGIATITSNLFDVVEEVAYIGITQQPTQTIGGELINGPPTIALKEVGTNNPVLANVLVSLSHNSFAVGSTTTVTTVNGIAVFDNIIVDTPGDYVLTFSVPGASGIDTAKSVSFTVLAIEGNLTITNQPAESLEGYPVKGLPTATILDSDDSTPMEGIAVTATLNKSGFALGTTTVNTNASGQAIFTDLVIDDVDTGYSIFFSVPVSSGVVGKTSSSFNVVEELATLSVNKQPTLTIDGEFVNGSPTVKVTNKVSGLPMNNVDVFVSLNNGSFASGTTTRKTNASGLAVFNNLVVNAPEDGYEIIFSTHTTNVADVSSNPFSVIQVAGTMTITTQPTETIGGYTIAGPPAIQILDGSSVGLENVSVTAILSKNSFAVGTETKLTSSEGIAVFDDLVINTVADGYTITFDVDINSGVVSKTSNPFDVVEEFAILSLSQQPSLTIAGQTINGPASVMIVNKATSNPIPSTNIYVSLNKGSLKVGSTTMVTTNASGIATFNNLIIDNVDADYQLIFSTHSSGIADITSSPFNIIAVAGEITISQQPLETVNGYTIAGPATILVKNLLDAPIIGLDVTATINKNSITSGTVTRATDGDGVVVFDDLILSAVATGYTLTFSTDVAEGIPNKKSASFKVVAEVAIITVEQQPTLTIAGELINGPPTVSLKTTGGAPIAGGNITVSLNKSSFAVGSTTTITTNASGIAIFNNLTIDDADTDYQLSFSTGSSGVAKKTSANFDIVPPLGIMTITQQPLETVNGQAVAGPPTVTITETNGDPWTGSEITITVSVNKNNISSGTVSKVTVSGVAIFDNLLLSAIGNDYHLQFGINISKHIANKVSDPFDVVAVAGYLSITTQPSETVEGDPIDGPPTVRLTNLSANGVSGVTISVTVNKNGFSGASSTTAVTNASGYATFNNLIIDDNDTGYKLTFTAVGASGVAPVSSGEFEVTDATLTMDVTAQPSETVAGNAITLAPKVQISSGIGDIEGVVVTATISKNSFASGSTLTATTDASGIATFDNLKINIASGGYTISFNANYSGVPNATSSSFGVTPASANYILATAQPQNTIAGNTIQGPPKATAYDAFGNAVPGVEVTVSPNQNNFASGTVSQTTNASGIAEFNDLILNEAEPNYQLFFASPGVTTGNSAFFAISNAAPDQITVNIHPSETVAGAAISGPPTVTVEDQFGNPVQGETVTISVVGGYALDGGTASLETPPNGVVAFTDLVINTVGTYQFRFAVDGLEQTSNTFSVVQGTLFSRFFGKSHSGFASVLENNIPLGQTPTRIEVMAHPLETVVGTEILGPPRVRVYDEYDNPIPDVPVTVTGAAFSAGSETLSTDISGEIVFNNLVIDVTGTFTLTFTVDAYPAVNTSSIPFQVIDVSATMLLTVQPQQTVAGQPVAGHPTIRIQNSIGMPIQGVEIVAFINQHNFAGGSVTTKTTDVNGIAIFDELLISKAATGFQLIFDADFAGVQNISSNTFNVVNASANSIVVATQPIETTEGATINGPPSATVYDQFGNTVAGIPVTVTEVLSGYAFDAGITTISTNSLGIAVFSTIVIENSGTYQLSFSASGLTDATSNTFQVTSGTVANRFKGSSHSGFTYLQTQNKLLGQIPVRIGILSQPQETVAGFIVEGPPRIMVYDNLDNPVANVQVTVSLVSGSFSSGTTTRTTNQYGEITFNNLAISEAGSYRLSFKADNHTATVTDEVSSLFNVVSQSYFMEVISQPRSSIAGQAISGSPAVSITNFIYQPLVGVNVTVYVNQHGFTTGTYTVQTDSEGEALFDDLVINTATTGYQLIFEADNPGVTNVTSEQFAVSNAPASQLSITAQPGTTIAGAAVAGPPSIRLTDDYGNPVGGATVSVVEAGGYSFDLGSATQLTNSFGEVFFDDLIINTIGQYSLVFSSTDVDDAHSMPFNVASGTVTNRFVGNSHSGFIVTETKDKYLGQTPRRIEMAAQPQETVINTVIVGPPRIVVYDVNDNPVGGVWINVTSSVAFTSGTTPKQTNSSGEVQFDDMVIDQLGTYQLTFTAVDYPSVSALSQQFSVVNQELFMTIQTQPAETVAGLPIAGHPAVKLKNAANQAFQGVDVTVYVNQFSFASASEKQTVTTNASGIAVFDEIVLNTAATGYQLIFDANYTGVVNVSSNAFNVKAADAHNISIITQPIDTEEDAAIGGPPAIRVTDEYGNLVSGINVTVSETGGYSFDLGTLWINSCF